MKVFHELIFDEYMEETTGGVSAKAYRARMHWWPAIGNVDSLRFHGVADRVSATVSLKWTLYDTPTFDTSHLHQVKDFTPMPSLTAGQTTTFQGSVGPADAQVPASYAYVLICSLQTVAKAHVRIWVTGRGRA